MITIFFSRFLDPTSSTSQCSALNDISPLYYSSFYVEWNTCDRCFVKECHGTDRNLASFFVTQLNETYFPLVPAFDLGQICNSNIIGRHILSSAIKMKTLPNVTMYRSSEFVMGQSIGI